MTDLNSYPLGLVSEFHKLKSRVWDLSAEACDLISKEFLEFLREIDEVHHIPQRCASFSWNFSEDKDLGFVTCRLRLYIRRACDFDQNYIDTVDPELFTSLLKSIDEIADQLLSDGQLSFYDANRALEAYTALYYTINKAA